MNKAFFFLAVLIFALGSAHAQKLYKWVDDSGNITYQDQPPPGADAAEYYAQDDEVIAENKRAKDPNYTAAANFPVTLFFIPVCDACDLVRNLLQKHNVPFTEKNASDGVAVQDELMELSGQLSVPLLAVGADVTYGYNSRAIIDQLTRAGYRLDGSSTSTGPGAGEQAGLTPEQIEEQATLAAEQLTSEIDEIDEFDEIVEEVEFADEIPVDEEIPEDERIKVQITDE